MNRVAATVLVLIIECTGFTQTTALPYEATKDGVEMVIERSCRLFAGQVLQAERLRADSLTRGKAPLSFMKVL